MKPIKYIRQKYYIPSIIKKSKTFIDDIKREAQKRQMVRMERRDIYFGVEGPIILNKGKFWSVSAHIKNGRWGKHWVLISPNLKGLIKRKSCFLRIDSGCTSGVLGDTTCDCLKQLRAAQEIALKTGGIIIYIPDQDGRGWQQEYKMANQRIMYETDLDTITVATKFYGDENTIDIRTFDEATLILRALGFPKGYKFYLGTKNPQKVDALLKEGFNVSTRPINIKCGATLIKHLEAKDKFFKKHIKEAQHA